MPLSSSASRLSVAVAAVLVAVWPLPAAPALAAELAGEGEIVAVLEPETGHDGHTSSGQVGADDLLEPDTVDVSQGGDDEVVEAFESFVDAVEYSDPGDDGVDVAIDVAVEEPPGEELLFEEPAPSGTGIDVVEPETEDVGQGGDDDVIDSLVSIVDVVDDANPGAGGFRLVNEEPTG